MDNSAFPLKTAVQAVENRVHSNVCKPQVIHAGHVIDKTHILCTVDGENFVEKPAEIPSVE